MEDLTYQRAQALTLKDENRQNAEDIFQVELLIATVEQSFATLIDYMSGIESQLETMNGKLNEKISEVLNLQNYYASQVKRQAAEVLKDNYHQIESHQACILDKMHDDLRKTTKEMVEKMDKATLKCHQSASRAEEANDRLFKVKTWWDLIWYAAPISVLLNLIFRVYQHFSGG